MRYLDILLGFGAASLATAFPDISHLNLDIPKRFEGRDSQNIIRRGVKEGHTSPIPHQTTSSTAGQNPGSTQSRPRVISPPPADSPPPSRDGSSPDRKASSPSTSSSQRTPGMGRDRRSSTRQDISQSLFPSPPRQIGFQRINPYLAMLGASRATIPQSYGSHSTGSVSMIQLQNTQTATRLAREARALANSRYSEAKRISDTRRATSPTTRDAMKKSLDASDVAVRATRNAAHQQGITGIDLIGTAEHHSVDNRLESAARRLARAEQRNTHNLAFEAQYHARLEAESIMKRPIGGAQLSAIQNTANLQKTARHMADVYYRDYEDYKQLKSQVPGDSSSSDDEQELTDYPKTWNVSRGRRL